MASSPSKLGLKSLGRRLQVLIRSYMQFSALAMAIFFFPQDCKLGKEYSKPKAQAMIDAHCQTNEEHVLFLTCK